MRLGILLTGRVNPLIVDRFGEYDGTFQAIYRAVEPALETECWPVLDDVFPESVNDADAWLVTGSKHGVYDDLPWIEPLKVFLREARAAEVPMIGICFGHQIMAEAFGGRAQKSDKGWGLGVQEYAVNEILPWMEGAAGTFRMHAFHQDQVTALPEEARTLASSPFCEAAMVSYGDAAVPYAISVQTHPEFTADYAGALLDINGGVTIPEDTASRARDTAGDAHDGALFVKWSLAYLRAALARRQAA